MQFPWTMLKKYSGFDELVFKNRNQEYGAYVLRKTYNKSVIVALLIAVTIICSIIYIPFIISKNKIYDQSNFGRARYAQLQIEHFDYAKEELPVPEINSPPPPSQPDMTYDAPLIVDSVPLIDKMQITDDGNNINQPSADSLDRYSKKGEDDLIFGEDENGDSKTSLTLESLPSFKGGGIEKFREWVSRNTNYPKPALQKNISGRVIVTFVIERDGSISNVKLKTGVNSLIDDEAINTIKASPKWSPGIFKGRPIRFRFSIPIIFKPR
jgi:protein TonB